MEELILGIQVVLIGMGVVVIALTLLAILTASMSKILAGKKVNPVSAPTIKEPVQREQEGELTPEILAVIAAAAASAINTKSTYKITTIKRIKHDLSPNWSRLGRYEQTTKV